MPWTYLRRGALAGRGAAPSTAPFKSTISPLQLGMALRLFDRAQRLVIARPAHWQPRRERLLRDAWRRLQQPGDPATGAELEMGIFEALRRERKVRRRSWVRRLWRPVGLGAALVLLCCLALLLQPVRQWIFGREIGHSASWKVNGTVAGIPAEGRGLSGRRPVFFHTDQRRDPAITIDLKGTHLVRKIKVWNRADCCGERALPLNIEAKRDGKWQLLCQRRAPFREYTCDHAVSARHLRIRRPGTGMLHLEKVEVFE